MVGTWYVELEGAASGPHTQEALEQLRAQGRVEASTLVWREGLDRWIPYAEAGLATPLPPPLPGRAPMGAPPPVEPAPPPRAAAPAPPLPTASPDPPDSAAPPAAAGVDIEPPNDGGWQSTAPAPWRRFFARSFDALLWSTLVWFAFGILLVTYAPEKHAEWFAKDSLLMNQAVASMVSCATVIPINALILGSLGTTLGKWIFGIRVTRSSGAAIGIGDAFGRELQVWVGGLAFGIPFLSLFTAWSAYKSLTTTGRTGWDKNVDWVVTQRPWGVVQGLAAVLGAIVWIMGFAVLAAMNRM